MKINILLILFFLIAVKSYPQINQSWIGIWFGELFIYNSSDQKTINTVHMELHISPADSASLYHWRMIYKDSANDDRKYLLRTLNENQGKYEIDERNGILIDAKMFNNKLLTRFNVQGYLSDVSYELDNDKIIFEVISGSDTPLRTTAESEENENVVSFNLSAYQKAILYKIQ